MPALVGAVVEPELHRLPRRPARAARVEPADEALGEEILPVGAEVGPREDGEPQERSSGAFTEACAHAVLGEASPAEGDVLLGELEGGEHPPEAEIANLILRSPLGALYPLQALSGSPCPSKRVS